jgi:hypothetical protein
MQFTHYFGAPGTGKTTLMRSFLNKCRTVEVDEFMKEGLVKYHIFPKQKIIIFGDYAEDKIFAGLDATSKAIGPKFREWVITNKSKYVGWSMYSEGERFSNTVMLDFLFEHTEMELILLQVSGEELERRRIARNNTQNETWLKGMTTRVNNLASRYPHTVLICD